MMNNTEIIIKDDFFQKNMEIIPAQCSFNTELITEFLNYFNNKYSDKNKEDRQLKINELISQDVNRSLPYINITRKEIKADRLKLDKLVSDLKTQRGIMIDTALGEMNNVINHIKRLEKIISVVSQELNNDENLLRDIETDVHINKIIAPIFEELIQEYGKKYPSINFSLCRIPSEGENEYYKKIKRTSVSREEHYKVLDEYIRNYAEIIQSEIDSEILEAQKERNIQEREKYFENYLNKQYEDRGIRILLSSVSNMIRKNVENEDIIDYINMLIESEIKNSENKINSSNKNTVCYEIEFKNKYQQDVFESWMRAHSINYKKK